MPNIKVNDFIRSTRAYVQENVKKANTNGNPYLTKAEAKKLPKDLRDNFEAHRKGAQENGSVSVKKFETNYVKYVAVHAQRADKNGDGILSARDLTHLPRDLKDNVANFIQATKGQHTLKSPAILRERILDAVNTQDWKGFLELADPQNVKGQKEMGIGQYQYIAEALGLHMVDNTLKGDITKKATLEQVAKITLQRAGEPDASGAVSFTGTATLKNGEKLKVNIDAHVRPDGTFWLTPAVG
jgi:hypothetical protein